MRNIDNILLQNKFSTFLFQKRDISNGIRMSVLSVLLLVFSLPGCNSGETNLSRIDSQRVDSLIGVLVINDRTILVTFGYDAVTAIKTSEGIVVVDAGISTSLTSRYKRIIEKKFGQENFIFVINSHGHHDHIRGNSVFGKAKIVGHENCRLDAPDPDTNKDTLLRRSAGIVNDYDRQLQQSDPDTREWEDNFTQKMRYSGSYLDISRNIPLKLPDVTFPDNMNLKCGDTTFEMIHFGRFHSNSDILIYVPGIKTLFVGDLFSKYGRPGRSNSLMADADKWIRALQWIEKRTDNIETVIDGHGQVLSPDDLKLFTDYLAGEAVE